MQEKLAQVRNLIERHFDSVDSEAFARFRGDFSFGKMLRSKLLLTIAPDSPHSTQMCAIIELIHFASLLHDDVIDSASLRRGKQSINAKYGDKNAIMLGDILYSKAFYEVATMGANLAQVISNAVYELSLGELDDVSLGESMNLDSRKYLAMVGRKTGALIEASAVCGGILKSNLSLTRPSRELEKFSFDRPQVLSQSNFSAQPTNLTQDTRIAEDLKDSSLRELRSNSWQSKSNCHFERSEKSQKNKKDSSLCASHSAQNDKIMDCHDSATQNLAMTENNTDSANQTKIAESAPTSSLRGSEATEAIQDSANAESNKNQSCDSTESRPLRGAKNRIQGCSSATADFLLEAEKRGSPPKSEKRELLARRGSGAGGAALLPEKTSESKQKNGENIADSAKQINVDCHDSAMQNLSMTENDTDSANQTKIAESSINSQNLNAESCTAHDLQDKQSKDLRCGFALFSRETSEIELGVHRTQFYAETAQIAYPKQGVAEVSLVKANCKQDDANIHKYRIYGQNLGIAFQIIDDLLDITQEDSTLGKEAFSDFKEGKTTLPYIYLYNALGESDKAILKSYFKKPLDSAQKEWIRTKMAEHNIIATIQQIAKDYGAKALSVLDSGDKNLQKIINDMIDREF
ncbi:polyprenyl synthetase family protein [Helicobacter sp. 23-1045]